MAVEAARQGRRAPIYVERLVAADLDLLWARTQEPAMHQRWDVRFTSITYLPGTVPQRFRYATRIVPGLTIAGWGETSGERHLPDGSATSALRFGSADPRALIAEGSGYWRYVPVADGVRFLTGYDYRPRWGTVGAVADRWVLRPLIGWGTAWSFDRLALWCERGLDPAVALRRSLVREAGRTAVVAAALALVPGRSRRGGRAGAVARLLAAAGLVALSRASWPGDEDLPTARRCLRRPPARESPG